MGGRLAPAGHRAPGQRSAARRGAGRALVALALGLAVVGSLHCASEPAAGGYFYRVRPGDTLYSIGRRHGVPPERLQRINRVPDVSDIAVGKLLWIPEHRNARPAPAARRPPPARPGVGGRHFAWPVRGVVTSGFGRRGRSLHEGIDIGGRRGTVIRAAAPGRVIRAGRLGDYGRIVIVKHAGDYSSVYAHLDAHRVRAGQFVEQGQPLGTMGRSGNARGVHLHFEIRRRDAPRDPMPYLGRSG